MVQSGAASPEQHRSVMSFSLGLGVRAESCTYRSLFVNLSDQKAMAKKNKDEAPNPNSVTNRDILQRLNFLYQASAYLDSIRVPEPAPPSSTQSATEPAPHPNAEAAVSPPPFDSFPLYTQTQSSFIDYETRSSRKLKNKSKNKGRKLGVEEIARGYVRQMKQIGQKTTVKMDPTVKRTLCKACDTVLVPGVSSNVRVTPSVVHGNAIVTTCLRCKTKRRIPAPPTYEPQSLSQVPFRRESRDSVDQERILRPCFSGRDMWFFAGTKSWRRANLSRSSSNVLLVTLEVESMCAHCFDAWLISLAIFKNLNFPPIILVMEQYSTSPNPSTHPSGYDCMALYGTYMPAERKRQLGASDTEREKPTDKIDLLKNTLRSVKAPTAPLSGIKGNPPYFRAGATTLHRTALVAPDGRLRGHARLVRYLLVADYVPGKAYRRFEPLIRATLSGSDTPDEEEDMAMNEQHHPTLVHALTRILANVGGGLRVLHVHQLYWSMFCKVK
ncbi:hypothetical protein EW146_g7668 [Bondarzewia mesenterica]|uniref:Rpr2-domain-containing protein n=1 Tax=Bondarzewia mesenterica TaxID=1095465 RepID=A0A4S4LM07_9AGAM|nr:hypothetical protein EW146_g7668 [Bondarzewia mesenterica]